MRLILTFFAALVGVLVGGSIAYLIFGLIYPGLRKPSSSRRKRGMLTRECIGISLYSDRRFVRWYTFAGVGLASLLTRLK